MNSSRPEFERFISRVHRRFVAVKFLEHTGLGVLAGCGVGLFLVIVAIWRGVPAAPLAAGGLTLGAFGGLVYALFNRPTLFDAAIEADRQIDTADLLSSALNTRGSTDPWADAVAASANAWARSVEPSSVLFNRLGVRAWGGIGLAAALLSVITLLPTYASPLQAADGSSGQSAPNTHPQDRPAYASGPNVRSARPEQQPEDLRSAHSTSEDPSSKPGDPSASAPGRSKSNSSDPAQGGGESHTITKTQKASESAESTQAKNSLPQGRAAGGTGQTAQNAASGDSNSSHSAGASPAVSAEPWKSSRWDKEAREALRAVDSGQVPDAYRDVIHDYFNRQ